MESEPISDEENFDWVKSINNIACSMSVNQIKPIMSGFLKKEGKVLKSWKKRFFSMMGNGIYYFENEKSNKSLGVIVLKPTSLVIVDKQEINNKRKSKGIMGLFGILEKDNINENTFGIVGDSYSDKFKCDRFFVFTAENQKDKENWIKIINQTIEKIKKIDQELEKRDPVKQHYLNNKDLPLMTAENSSIKIFKQEFINYLNHQYNKFSENTKFKELWYYYYYYMEHIIIKKDPLDLFLKIKCNYLHYAAFYGYTHIVSYFIKECGNDVELKANEGSTPLHFATLYGQLMTIKFLIEECDADIEAENNEGFTPLLIAAANGYLYVVKYLIIEKKANVKAITKSGFSIIDLVKMNEQENIYKYLTEKLKFSPVIGGLVLTQAAKINNLNLLKKLYEKEKLDPNKANNKGLTAICFAALNGNIEMLQYLIEECKVDTNIKLKNGANVLNFALEGKNFDIIKYIVENCNPDPNGKTENNLNIYHSAVISENIEILQYIWNKYPNEKAILEEGGDKGWTPFHYAIYYGQNKMVCFFVENCKANIKIKSKEGYSVMTFAAKYGNANILRYFNENYELDYNEINDKRHILFLSIENGNLDSLKFFLDDKDIDANIRDYKGWTPMHVAAYFGHLNIIKYLVEEKDCTPYIEFDNKYTPAIIANQQRNFHIINYLVSKFGPLKTNEIMLY